MELIGRLYGLSAMALEKARVLDIGCGLGTLLLNAAQQFPDAHFVGIDHSDEMVREAESRRLSLGLSNVQFLQITSQACSFLLLARSTISSHSEFILGFLLPLEQRCLNV